MTERTRTARVHRFRDSVAVSIGDGSTVYLSPRLAHALASAIERHAADVGAVPFTDSRLATVDLQEDEGGRVR